MSANEPVDEVFDELEAQRRRRLLVFIALAGGAIGLGLIGAAAAAMARRPFGVLYFAALCALGGVIVGLGHAPVLGATLARRRWSLALPLVYGAPLTLALGLMAAQAPLPAVIAFCAGVPIVSVAALLLPRAASRSEGRCYQCGYDLSAAVSPICPECGALIAAASRPDSDAHPARPAPPP